MSVDQIRRRLAQARRHPLKALRWAIHKPLRPRSPQIRTVSLDGCNFAVRADHGVGWRLISIGDYERDQFEALAAHIRPEDVVVDVGANIGLYSVLLAKRVPEGRVMAFEPVDECRELLQRNIESNSVRNVQVYDSVLSRTEGPVEFGVTNDAAYSSIKATGRDVIVQTLTRTARRLDTMIGSSEDIGAMKIDVEGAELAVLEGCSDLLADARRKPRAILVELNLENQRAYGTTPEDVVNLLEGFGYRANAITPGGVVPEWPRRDAFEDVLFLTSGESS